MIAFHLTYIQCTFATRTNDGKFHDDLFKIYKTNIIFIFKLLNKIKINFNLIKINFTKQNQIISNKIKPLQTKSNSIELF